MSTNGSNNTLTYAIEERENAVIISLQGAANVGQTAVLDQCTMRAQAYRKPLFVLDLTNLTFISSIGIGSLLTMKRSAERHGAKFRVAGVQGHLADLFDTSGLMAVFAGPKTVEAALAEPV